MPEVVVLPKGPVNLNPEVVVLTTSPVAPEVDIAPNSPVDAEVTVEPNSPVDAEVVVPNNPVVPDEVVDVQKGPEAVEVEVPSNNSKVLVAVLPK